MSGEHPGVLIRPPFLYAAAGLLAIGLDRLIPIPLLPAEWAGPVSKVWLAAGLMLFIACAFQFSRHRTTVSTHGKPSHLIVTGPFRFSRNPIYVALTLLYLFVVCRLNSGWALILLAPVLVVMQKGVIEREERFLLAQFGEPYARYMADVRRWI